MHTQYGHFRCKFGGQQYDFIPSFEAMNRIGNEEDLMKVFASLHHIAESSYFTSIKTHNPQIAEAIRKQAGKAQLRAAHLVLSSCCTSDCSAMIGKFSMGKKFYYQPGFESPTILIELAKSLMHHGIVGESSSKVVNKSREAKQELDITKFVQLARLHLNFSRDEAWHLTMTEFLSLWEEKFPPDDKQKDAAMSNEEYMDSIKRLEAIRDKTLRGKNNG
ncbi:MAG: hypothetical protein GY928_36430 [Colwellia sp.]|nr:hypothetical protein [Colwellia sp.]